MLKLEDKPVKKSSIILDTTHIAKYMWVGINDRTWYNEVEETIVKIFGRDQLEFCAKLLAATSIHTSLKGSLVQFKKAKHQIENGLPIKGYLPNIISNLELVRDGKDLSGRKISNFAKAMAGDESAIVVDIWILRAFGQDKKYMRKASGLMLSRGASDREYAAIETYLQKEAPQMGLQPRQLCSMIWGGVRTCETGRGNTTRYQEMLLDMFTDKPSLF